MTPPAPHSSSPGALRVSPEELVSAAGALDALVEEFWTQQPTTPMESTIDTGHGTFSAAVSEFLDAWNTGLHVLLQDQRTTARGLRRAASDVLGVDVDVAYAFQSLGYTVEPA